MDRENESGMNSEMEYLLSKDTFRHWIWNEDNQELIETACSNAIRRLYLKEHGLPLDSEIVG